MIDRCGFTLLEVMIAMTIFLIGILAVGSMQITSIESNSSARRQTEAAVRASAWAESLMSLPYESIVSGGPVAQGAYTLNWNVTDDAPLTNTKTITVTVIWKDPKNRSYSFDFIKADII